MHEVDWHVLLLQTGDASRDVPKVMQLEEGVDVVNEHEEQLVVTAQGNAERTERQRDTSSQSRRQKMPPFFGERPKTHKWVPRKPSHTDCLSQVISGGGDALAAKNSHNIKVAAEERTGGDLQANPLAINTLREVKAMITTLMKQVQLAPASVNIVRGKADRRNSMETARCETVIIFRVLQCCSCHTAAFES